MATKYGIREQGYNITDPEYNSKSIWVEATEGGDVPVGEGLPPGGDPGQVLTKVSTVDYDAEWRDPAGGGGGVPAGGTTGQIIIKDSDEDYDASWKDAPYVDTTSYNATIAGIQHDIENLSELVHDGITEDDVRDIITGYHYVDTQALNSALSAYATKAELQSEVDNLSTGIDDNAAAIASWVPIINNKITNPSEKSEGQVLTYDGNNWVAKDPEGGGGGDVSNKMDKVNPTGSGLVNVSNNNIDAANRTSHVIVQTTDDIITNSLRKFLGVTALTSNLKAQVKTGNGVAGLTSVKGVIIGTDVKTGTGTYNSLGSFINIGDSNTVGFGSTSDSPIVIGNSNNANATSGMVIGHQSTLSPYGGVIAIGKNIQAGSNNGVYIGNHTYGASNYPFGLSIRWGGNSRIMGQQISATDARYVLNNGRLFLRTTSVDDENAEVLTKAEIIALIQSYINPGA